MKTQIKGEVLHAKIPSSLIQLSKSFGTYKKSHIKLLKFYAVTLHKYDIEKTRRLKRGYKKRIYVPLASCYFEKVFGKEYNKPLRFLKEHGYISAKGYGTTGNTIFEDRIVESYQVGVTCKKYTVLIEPSENDLQMKFPLKFSPSTTVQKNENFLQSINQPTKITTDNYGGRLYHPLITTYKTALPKNGDMVYYDFKTSIPHHARYYMINKEFTDPNFLELFDGDFYMNWGKSLGLSTRQAGKDCFVKILYGKGKKYSPQIVQSVKDQYPKFWALVKKDFGRKTVRIETQFVFDQVVSKLPVNEVLTIHDGFFVYRDKENEVDDFLKSAEWFEDFPYTKEIW